MDVHVDQAGQHCLARQVDQPGALRRGVEAGGDALDPAVDHNDGRGAERRAGRIGDHPAGMDDYGLSRGGRGDEQQDQSEQAGEHRRIPSEEAISCDRVRGPDKRKARSGWADPGFPFPRGEDDAYQKKS
jgi:hypothetical protein